MIQVSLCYKGQLLKIAAVLSSIPLNLNILTSETSYSEPEIFLQSVQKFNELFQNLRKPLYLKLDCDYMRGEIIKIYEQLLIL